MAGCTDLFDGCGAWAGLTTRCVGPVGGHGVGALAARYVSPLGGRVCWPVWRPGVSAHLAVGCVDPFGGQVCRPIWWPGVLAHLVARGVGLVDSQFGGQRSMGPFGGWARSARLAVGCVGPFGCRECWPIWRPSVSAHLVVVYVGPFGGRVCWAVGCVLAHWRPGVLARWRPGVLASLAAKYVDP